MNTKPKIVGISGSLRNARWGKGLEDLVQSISQIEDENSLREFLTTQSELHLQNFLDAGRSEGKEFNEIYKNLRSQTGRKGLSNSEIMLVSALWAARFYDIEIEHISLAEYFTASGQIRNIDYLKDALRTSDGIIVSGPVYFGDRGSLVQSFIDMLRNDPELRMQISGKLYSGLAVGAKRNGGQETTLVYQLIDFLNAGFLGLGNDSDTTSQYGGTGVAGDVGTMHKDNYGINTALGTGRRIGRIAKTMQTQKQLGDDLRVLALVLQDSQDKAKKLLDTLISGVENLSVTTIAIDDKNIMPCIACDFCPTHIDVDAEYRCIIKSGKDDLSTLHSAMLDHDVILPVVLSQLDRTDLHSNYQRFLERTRYLRRGDYVWSDTMVAPIVFEEIGSHENYALRMVTSFLRHHTVMHKPIIGHLDQDKILRPEKVAKEFQEMITKGRAVAAGRLSGHSELEIKYNPVGYILSSDKDAEDERLQARKSMIQDRIDRFQTEATNRLV